MTKQELRTFIRTEKAAMTLWDITCRSRELCSLVLKTEAYRQARTIYGYLPFNQEVDLSPLLMQALADGKQVALPKCRNREMSFVLVPDLQHIQHTSFGVPEPVDDDPVACDKDALVIVPGLAFDRRGFRIGYGGGYYDKFLRREPTHPTIGLCFDFQLVDRLEPESHDIPVDAVFSI